MNTLNRLRYREIWFVMLIVIFVVNRSMAAEYDIKSADIVSAAKKVEWHGYYEFEYWDIEDKKNTFDAHKIATWMGVPINDMVFLSTEIEYEHFPRLEDAGSAKDGGSGEIKVDSAQLRITPVKNTAAYVGIFYVPFGIEYLSYPGQKNKLVTRPKVMKSGDVIPGTWSDVGIGLNQGVSGIGQADIFLVNGDPKNGGISRDSSSGGNENKSVGGRLQFDGLAEGINFGGSFVSGKWDDSDSNISNRIGAHIQIDTKKLSGIDMSPLFIGEYVTGKDKNGSSVTDKDKKVSGFYAQISSYITQNFELAARYGEYDNDKEVADNKKKELSLGLGIHVLENFQIKGEYQINFEESSNKKNNNAGVIQFVAFW